MSKTDTGGNAFPVGTDYHTGGMTLRDAFAMAALAAIISKHPAVRTHTDDDTRMITVSVANGAYQYADAMLAERNKSGD